MCLYYLGRNIYLCVRSLSKAIKFFFKKPWDAHLFDPRFDAMTEPQLSGCSLTGAEYLTNLPVWEAVLFGFQQQLLWHPVTEGIGDT